MEKKKKLKNDVRSLNACNAFLIKRAFNRIAFQFASGTTLRTNRTIHRCFVFSPRSSKARSMQRSHVGSKMYVKRGRCLCSQWICATTNEGGGEVAFGANPTASALLQTRKCSRQRENKKKKRKKQMSPTFVKQSRRGWNIGRPVWNETTKSIFRGRRDGRRAATPWTLPFVFDKFNAILSRSIGLVFV